MREYTILACAAAVGAVLLDRVARTHLFRHTPYWCTMAICVGFMLPVNGWLTKLSAPVVIYAAEEHTGWRPILDIPVEDYLFAFALITSTLVLWDVVGRDGRPRRASASQAPTPGR